MNRLTFRDRCGNALLAPEHEEKYTPVELIGILIDRLAAYEDSNLTQEEVVTVAQAKKEGRLAVDLVKPGDEVWAVERDEDGNACEVSGYMYLASCGGFVILSIYINDIESLEETMEEHSQRTAEDYNTDAIAVFPVEDCFTTLEGAETALKDMSNDE